MGEPKFTPGPWGWNGDSLWAHAGHEILHDYGYEGIRWAVDLSGPEIEANKAVMAAAPEMYSDAHELLSSLKRFSELSGDDEDQAWHHDVLPKMRSLESALSRAHPDREAGE